MFLIIKRLFEGLNNISNRKEIYIKCEIEEIPDLDPFSEEWDKWCIDKGVTPMGSSRRGWWSELNTYIRGGKYIIYLMDMPVEIVDDQELADLTRS